MKKTIKYLILFIIVSLISLLSYNITRKITYKNEVAERIKTIPDFSFKTLKGNDFTKENITKDRNTVFIYFNSECEHCQYEAYAIREQLNNFTNTQILFISFENKSRIKTFAKEYKLDNKMNVFFLHDKDSNFSEIFDAHHIPFTLIYNRQQKLVKKYIGEVKIEAILKSLAKK